jgi:transmembrane sensor
MRTFRLFSWLRSDEPPRQADSTSRLIDDGLAKSSGQLHAVNPETDEQWRRLQLAMVRKQSAAAARRKFVWGGLLRPAIPFAVAAVVFIVAGVVWLRNPFMKTYETSKGEHATITLQDSTEVTLNHTSELTVFHRPFEKERRVALKGEAFFRVRRNGTLFIVSTDVGTVQVLGTEFNVRVRNGRMEAGVLSGSVKVNFSSNGTGNSLLLTKDQIIACAKDEVPGMPGLISFSDYPGWMHGKLVFYHTDLLSACRELESQFNVVIAITIEAAQLRSETITGTIDGQTVETALTTLVRLTGNKYRHENSGYTIY